MVCFYLWVRVLKKTLLTIEQRLGGPASPKEDIRTVISPLKIYMCNA